MAQALCHRVVTTAPITSSNPGSRTAHSLPPGPGHMLWTLGNSRRPRPHVHSPWPALLLAGRRTGLEPSSAAGARQPGAGGQTLVFRFKFQGTPKQPSSGAPGRRAPDKEVPLGKPGGKVAPVPGAPGDTVLQATEGLVGAPSQGRKLQGDRGRTGDAGQWGLLLIARSCLWLFWGSGLCRGCVRGKGSETQTPQRPGLGDFEGSKLRGDGHGIVAKYGLGAGRPGSVPLLPLQLRARVAFGHLFRLSGPRLLHLKNGNIALPSWGCWESRARCVM